MKKRFLGAATVAGRLGSRGSCARRAACNRGFGVRWRTPRGVVIINKTNLSPRRRCDRIICVLGRDCEEEDAVVEAINMCCRLLLNIFVIADCGMPKGLLK